MEALIGFDQRFVDGIGLRRYNVAHYILNDLNEMRSSVIMVKSLGLLFVSMILSLSFMSFAGVLPNDTKLIDIRIGDQIVFAKESSHKCVETDPQNEYRQGQYEPIDTIFSITNFRDVSVVFEPFPMKNCDPETDQEVVYMPGDRLTIKKILHGDSSKSISFRDHDIMTEFSIFLCLKESVDQQIDSYTIADLRRQLDWKVWIERP